MRRKLLSLAFAAAFALAFSAPRITLASPQPANTPAAKAAPAPRGAMPAEPHPEIDRAMRLLNQAKTVLQTKAAHDFGGHRVKAIAAIDEALGQLQKALEADRH